LLPSGTARPVIHPAHQEVDLLSLDPITAWMPRS